MTRHFLIDTDTASDDAVALVMAMQYPVRNVDVLKKLLSRNPDIIYVSNEKNFREKIMKSGFRDYFIDLFAGDFGHCSRKGNALIVENLGPLILEQAGVLPSNLTSKPF